MLLPPRCCVSSINPAQRDYRAMDKWILRSYQCGLEHVSVVEAP